MLRVGVMVASALLVSCASAPKAEPIRVAVAWITPMIPDEFSFSATASELIEDRLSRCGRFKIVKSNRLAVHPRESAVEYGRSLGADWVVSGMITRADMQGQVGEVDLNVRIEKVVGGEVVFDGSRRGKAEGRSGSNRISILNRAVQDAAQKLVHEVVELAP